MTGFTPTKVALTEYQAEPTALAKLEAESGRTSAELMQLMAYASERLRRELALPTSPIEVTPGGLQVAGLAGLLRIAPGIEMEVAPKFLGSADPSWRGDFFIVASISRFGRVLETDPVIGGYGDRGDLATLVGRTATRLHAANHRRPLRLYRQREWMDFGLEGDVDAESVLAPAEQGLAQTSVSLESNNVFNQVMGEAFRTLLPEIRDPDVRRQVLRTGSALPRLPQPAPRRVPTRVPGRHRQWQTLYDLAKQVIAGFGIEYAGRDLLAPGYAVKTADAWQDLVSFALEARLGTTVAQRLVPYDLGTRGSEVVKVTPDISISFPSGSVLVDPKYKGRADDDSRKIAPADLYEAIAFARASGLDRVLLTYPRPASRAKVELGTTQTFDRVDVQKVAVLGVEVECRGLSGSGGFRTFASTLATNIETIAASS